MPDGLTQVALKYLLIIRNYMKDIESILNQYLEIFTETSSKYFVLSTTLN